MDNLQPFPWIYEYDEKGGYDHMTPGYHVKDADGELVFTVDCADFEDQEVIPIHLRHIHGTWQERGDSPTARAVAALVVNAVNSWHERKGEDGS